MNENIKCLTKACKLLNIDYVIHHATNNLVTVAINNSKYVFLNCAVPFNSQSVAHLCQDKDFFHSYYKDCIRIPKTISFFNPYCDEKYEKYLNYKTIYEIIKKIESSIEYPLIVKRNRGSWGKNVFSVKNQKELEKGLLAIFNKNDSLFDYVCLAQEKINIAIEYRVIYFLEKYMFAYKKNIANATFAGNLSPSHWKGASTSLVNENETKKLIEFCSPMFDNCSIPYCGLDIALDTSGIFWLIESNSAPGFGYFIKDQGDSLVVKLYESMLSYLVNEKAGL